MPGPDEVKKMIEDAGGTVEKSQLLPEGEGFIVASFPLPKDHWLYKDGINNSPMGLRMLRSHTNYERVEKAVREAARYAVRASTMNGKDNDFDPDALVQNMIVGLLGYHTPNGLSEAWENPDPVPDLTHVYFYPENEL